MSQDSLSTGILHLFISHGFTGGRTNQNKQKIYMYLEVEMQSIISEYVEHSHR